MIISNILTKFKNLVNKLSEILCKLKSSLVREQVQLKQQENLKRIKSRPIEPFDYYDNKLTYTYDPKDDEHLFWLKNKYYKFCLYSYSDEPKTIYLSNVEVKRKHRKHGYGNILLKHAKQLAKERGYESMYLKVAENTWQEKWYKRNGFYFFVDDVINWIWLKYDIV